MILPRRTPWITLGFAAASLAASVVPGAAATLEYARGEAAYRLLTGQLVHWGWAMAATDLLVLVAAGAWIEGRSRALAAAGIAASLAAVAVAVGLASPELTHYRGSSGVAVGLVAFAASDLALMGPGRATRTLALGALAVLAVKTAVEIATGASVLPWRIPQGIVVAGKAHAAGVTAGVLLALGKRLKVAGAGRRNPGSGGTNRSAA